MKQWQKVANIPVIEPGVVVKWKFQNQQYYIRLRLNLDRGLGTDIIGCLKIEIAVLIASEKLIY